MSDNKYVCEVCGECAIYFLPEYVNVTGMDGVFSECMVLRYLCFGRKHRKLNESTEGLEDTSHDRK